MKEKRLRKNIWFVILIAGAASVPLLTDYVLMGSRLSVTISQIKVMSQGLGKAFPLRLAYLEMPEYENGAVLFQANVFYLIPALLHRLGMELGSAYKWTLLLCNLTTASVAFACFEKCTGRREIGLIGSMLYTWCPYRCSDMYLVGDLGEIAAWSFLPIVMLGLKQLYTKDKEEDYGKLWVVLAWGFGLLAVSSMVFLAVGIVMALLVLFAMGKEVLRRKTLVVLGKAFGAILAISAWFLVPMLSRLGDASTVGAMLVQDIQGMGMYLAQYLTVFPWAGDKVRLTEEGMRGAQAMGPGIGVILLVCLYLCIVFTGKLKENPALEGKDWRFAGKILCVGAILAFLSTNLFPWDLFENKNMLFSIGLALLHTPAKLGVAADICFVLVGCMVLQGLSGYLGKKEYGCLLFATGAVSFGTTQFLLDNILVSRQLVIEEEIAALPFSLLTEESIIWRISEGISAVTLCGFLIVWMVRKFTFECPLCTDREE